MSESKRIKILVVDDHLVVRQGFSVILSAFPDIELVGEAQNGQQALEQCATLQPDIVLMDMLMPVMDGATAIGLIQEQYPHIQCIALTSFTDDRQLVKAALEAKAVGYLFKNVSVKELKSAIYAAYEGRPTLTTEVARMLLEAQREQKSQDFDLSEREAQVLKLMILGRSNADIAQALTISVSTVKFHVSNILGKLGASSRAEAVYIANERRLFDE